MKPANLKRPSKFEDPDVDVASHIRAPKIQLRELKIGQQFRGRVVSTHDFGCFVDIGAERDGLVHRSCMSRKGIASVKDFVMRGQMVDVWVKSVEFTVKGNLLGLTMIEGLTAGGGRQQQEYKQPTARPGRRHTFRARRSPTALQGNVLETYQ